LPSKSGRYVAFTQKYFMKGIAGVALKDYYACWMERMLKMPGSDIAQMKERIAAEYMAAQWGLYGLAYGVSKHQFITNRMERMQESEKELAGMVGNQQAMIIVAEMLARLPEEPERAYVQDVIRHIRGDTEQTARLIARIEEMWQTMDTLLKDFGPESGSRIIHALGEEKSVPS
jgi:hypothetical protein